jgi:hypothetical protein
MHINVIVSLDSTESFAYTPDAAAMQVLVALGGDPANDYSQCSIQSNQVGTAGTVPTPAEPPPA